MKITTAHKKHHCPQCGSKEILTLGIDQICTDCDWDNSLLLVQLGQLDNPFKGARLQFEEGISFDSLRDNTDSKSDLLNQHTNNMCLTA
jgi:hypothetical protein